MTTRGTRSRLKASGRLPYVLPLLLPSALLLALLISPLGAVQGQTEITVHLRDTFRFDPSIIQVDPGENVTLHLVNDGVTTHTFTLFAPPNAAPPLNDFPGLSDFYNNNVKLVDVSLSGGEEVDVNFTAPALEANYVYVCMIAGHSGAGMHGVLQVGEGMGAGPGFSFPLGPIQTMMLIALSGAIIFAIVYHFRTRGAG